jgi:hypothetical protein
MPRIHGPGQNVIAALRAFRRHSDRCSPTGEQCLIGLSQWVAGARGLWKKETEERIRGIEAREEQNRERKLRRNGEMDWIQWRALVYTG